MAMSRMEKEEKKMQVAWVPPTSLHTTSYNTSTQLKFDVIYCSWIIVKQKKDKLDRDSIVTIKVLLIKFWIIRFYFE